MSNGPTQSVRLVSLWPILLILLFVIPGISGFSYPSAEAQYTDIAISHYPNAIYLKETLRYIIEHQMGYLIQLTLQTSKV